MTFPRYEVRGPFRRRWRVNGEELVLYALIVGVMLLWVFLKPVLHIALANGL